MSIPTLTKNYFLIVAHDQPDARVRRTKHVPEHMAYNQPFIQNRYFVAGGALLPEGVNASDADVHGKIVGSYMVVQADTAEQVWEALKKDVFYTSGEVWDHSRIAVTPVFSAFPNVE